MSTLNTVGIGREHNRLAETAAQLTRDGHDGLAAEYQARAETETEIFVSVRDLTRQAKHVVTRDGENADEQTGAELAAWLVRQGWTPPAHFNGRIEE